jgi:hypothetical protein
MSLSLNLLFFWVWAFVLVRLLLPVLPTTLVALAPLELPNWRLVVSAYWRPCEVLWFMAISTVDVADCVHRRSTCSMNVYPFVV